MNEAKKIPLSVASRCAASQVSTDSAGSKPARVTQGAYVSERVLKELPLPVPTKTSPHATASFSPGSGNNRGKSLMIRGLLKEAFAKAASVRCPKS